MLLRRTIYILIFCLLYLANPVYSEECKLVNITALLTSNSMVVHWKPQGPCQIKKYTVEASHLNYKACPDLNLNNNEDSKVSNHKKTSNEQMFFVEKSFPRLLFKVEIPKICFFFFDSFDLNL